MTHTRKLHFQNYIIDASTYVGEVGSLFFDPTTTVLRIGDGTTPGGNSITGGSGSLPSVTITSAGESETANDSTGDIFDAGIEWWQPGAADVLFTVTSDDTLVVSGTIQFWSGGVGTTVGNNQSGANGVRFLAGSDMTDFVVMAYATNAAGTVYSAPASGTSRPLCLAAGTMIALSDGTYKLIEDIDYSDDLLVWDFDNGRFAESKPLWIKSASTEKRYNVLQFSDGTSLSTVGQHRIFNKEATRFTYPLTDDTPIGATTYNQFGKEVTLVEKHIEPGHIGAYNIITDYHLNLFANGILTSTSFNNIYPIVDMKFVKDDRLMRQDAFQAIPDRFYYGMRLQEQTRDAADIERYIRRLMATADRLVDA